MSCPLVRMGGPLEEVLSWSAVHSLHRISPASFQSFPSGSRLVLQLVDRGHICLGVRLEGTHGDRHQMVRGKDKPFVFTFANFFVLYPQTL